MQRYVYWMSAKNGVEMTEVNAFQALLSGADPRPHIVAAEWSNDTIQLFTRAPDQSETCNESIPFAPYILLADPALLQEVAEPFTQSELDGSNALRIRVDFTSWADATAALKTIKATCKKNSTETDAPYYFVTDPVQHYLMDSGQTLFKELQFSDLRRMQIDIETFTADGFDFCNADRDSDRITAIAVADNSGWSTVLNGAELSEKELLQQLVDLINKRDPDVIEGHNIFNFDLPYIVKRAKKCSVKLAIGRNGKPPTLRASRMTIGERTVSYTRVNIFGRHIIDTYLLVQLYDITSRSLDSFGLKNVAIHFNVAAPDRTYVDGSTLAQLFLDDPDQLMKYAHDDILETRSIAAILSPVYFAQTQLLPFSYQTLCVRGNATRIDAMLIRAYLHLNHSIPLPEPRMAFAGGYTDMFYQGVAEKVHHCDVRSLYPSLMLKEKLGPARDEAGVFLSLLEHLRSLRLQFKDRMNQTDSPQERTHCDTMQSSLKILINSFYGYLGFAQGHFNDFQAAADITAHGRKVLKKMIELIRAGDGHPIEIDTDGIYYIPPPSKQHSEAEFQDTFRAGLPDGIDVEFDGRFKAMYSYKMKNYALLTEQDELLIKGAALKSRGLERFQRDYLRAYLRLKLEKKDAEIHALQKSWEDAISRRTCPISMLAKTERLQNDPATYAKKIEQGSRSRNAAYELALKAPRDYRAGDQLSFYVTGDTKSVTVYAAAKLTADWDPNHRDENVPYYLDKLRSLFKKFGAEVQQPELF